MVPDGIEPATQNNIFIYKKGDTLMVSRDRMSGEEQNWFIIYSLTKWINKFLFRLNIDLTQL